MVLVTHCITYAFELITRQLLFKNAISPQNSRQHQCITTSFAKCHPRFQSNNFSSLLASPVAAYDFYLCECVIHSPIDQLAGSWGNIGSELHSWSLTRLVPVHCPFVSHWIELCPTGLNCVVQNWIVLFNCCGKLSPMYCLFVIGSHYILPSSHHSVREIHLPSIMRYCRWILRIDYWPKKHKAEKQRLYRYIDLDLYPH